VNSRIGVSPQSGFAIVSAFLEDRCDGEFPINRHVAVARSLACTLGVAAGPADGSGPPDVGGRPAPRPSSRRCRCWRTTLDAGRAALVFAMHLGFAMLESGLTQAKNTTNILFKNTAIVAIGLLTYALCGFNLMYPGEDFAGGWFGFAGFGIGPGGGLRPGAYADGGYTYWTDFIFQAMFAATAATIVSGAVAERIKLGPFLSSARSTSR
jgi:hypothetical protein